MTSTILIILLVVAAIIAFALKTAGALQNNSSASANDPDLQYERRAHLMTPAERSFFGVLEQALEQNWYIFSKVRLEDIIQVKKGIDKKKAFGLRNRIKSRHIDFILCDRKTLETVMCIELDDASHKRKDRIERDKFIDSALSVADVPIVRIPAKASYSVEFIKSQLLEPDQPERNLEEDDHSRFSPPPQNREIERANQAG